MVESKLESAAAWLTNELYALTNEVIAFACAVLSCATARVCVVPADADERFSVTPAIALVTVFVELVTFVPSMLNLASAAGVETV